MSTVTSNSSTVRRAHRHPLQDGAFVVAQLHDEVHKARQPRHIVAGRRHAAHVVVEGHRIRSSTLTTEIRHAREVGTFAHQRFVRFLGGVLLCLCCLKKTVPII